jgi:hypothetical protein
MATDIPSFIARWRDFGGEERANKDSFFIELCEVLGIAPPRPKSGDPEKDTYVFEADVRVPHEGGTVTTQKADVYKAGCFVLEAKQGRSELSTKLSSAKRGTNQWQEAMASAKGQALGYASMMVKPPPFLVVADLGYCFDLYASFEGSGQYAPFPGPRLTESRLFVADLAKHADLLRTVFTDPRSLDPAARIAKITTEVAAHLAGLASKLEEAGHPPELVARFLMRCLFTMFAEDVGLLPADPRTRRGLFTGALQDLWIPSPKSFPAGIEGLWRAMNAGSDFGFMGKLLRFNGGLFAESAALALDKPALEALLEAAKHDWSEVDPAIFGTLLERALSPKERHALGAHYTPRAYVERLVRPTVEEPLRADWEVAQAEVRILVEAGKVAPAKKVVRAFHEKLCQARVLDPACGSGNFLYVALDLLQRLEDEVLDKLEALGETQQLLAAGGLRVTPAQFLGIEKKPWAKEIAELVLWIGYLQHHVRARGKASPPPEPVLQDYQNIACRDAVLAWDSVELVRDERGKPVTRWDGETTKKSPVTGKDIPDESAQVPVEHYVNPRRAKWPRADYIVGNPPFIGNKRMRAALGDGYVEALRAAYPYLPDSVDFVMYWWNKAARRVATGKVQRMGLITTNSITQTFNRTVVSRALEGAPPVSLAFAIPNHPWVDSTDGAQVRIAMTMVVPWQGDGQVYSIVDESLSEDGVILPSFHERRGVIHADLRIGADIASTASLQACQDLSFMGVILVGQGFVVDSDDNLTRVEPQALKPYLVGNELNKTPKQRLVIDFFDTSLDEARRRFPRAFQRVIEQVKPERDANKDATFRANWWLHGRPRVEMRGALRGLPRFIAICRTAKHFVFQFVPGDVIVESKVVAIASDDASILGILSSRAHLTYAIAAGSRHGVGNDLTYNNSRCFETFPFPVPTDSQAARIRDLGEQLDAHRKRQQAAHPTLTITGMYNVLEKLRSGEALSAKDRVVHAEGLVSVLRQIHDDLDQAVFEAYGWPKTLTDEAILERLVALNAERAEEEKRGLVRWLRPEFQNAAQDRGGKPAATQTSLAAVEDEEEPARSAKPAAKTGKAAWPKRLDEQVVALRDLMLKKTTGWTAQQVAETFRGVTPKSVSPLLDTLASLGVVVAYEARGERKWRAARVG